MSFSVPAEAYERYMGRWSRQLSSQLADFAGVRAGQRVFVVGSGPGIFTDELVHRVGPANLLGEHLLGLAVAFGATLTAPRAGRQAARAVGERSAPLEACSQRPAQLRFEDLRAAVALDPVELAAETARQFELDDVRDDCGSKRE